MGEVSDTKEVGMDDISESFVYRVGPVTGRAHAFVRGVLPARA